MANFVSRAGEKLQFALKSFGISVKDLICADFGSSTGGFVDCLLQNGAKKVYAVEVGYGTIDWNLRNDPRVVVMERTNAMHVILPEKIGLIKRAQEYYQGKIDLEHSFFIGDSTTDVKCGQNAGIKTILVKTGKTKQDKKEDVKPDFTALNLLEAANIIEENSN